MEQTINDSEKNILIVDGLNIFLRHYTANPATTPKGETVGGIVGFMQYLFYMMNVIKPTKVIVVWEQGGPSPRRKALYPEYKANRAKTFSDIREELKQPATPQQTPSEPVRQTTFSQQIKRREERRDIVPQNRTEQMLTLVKMLRTLPIFQLFLKDTECDDIIGYLVQNYFKDAARITISSSDNDFYQLLESSEQRRVSIFDPVKKLSVNVEDVIKKTNIHPKNYCLAKCVNGDQSDNIPGIKGIGFATLSKEFPEFTTDAKELTIQDLFDQVKDKTSDPKMKKKTLLSLKEGEEQIRLNWKLMHLSSSIFSYDQTEKIKFQLENYTELKNAKIPFLAIVTPKGITFNFDYEMFFLKMKYLFNLNVTKQLLLEKENDSPEVGL